MAAQAHSNGGTPHRPTISVGVPVYNGEDYLAELMHALQAQTYTDFEIVISDNASTDSTGAICADFARRESRIRYHRNETNIGPLANFNNAFHLAKGKYFCWICHDDLIEPTFLEECLRVLEADDDVVLSFSNVQYIGPDRTPLPLDPRTGQFVCGGDGFVAPFPEHVAEQDRVVPRFADIMHRADGCYESGLVRREQLAKTSLQGDFYGVGEIWMMELAMQGRFSMLDEKLFLRRFHPKASFFVPTEQKDAWIAQTTTATKPADTRRFRWTRAYLDVIRRAPTLSEGQRLQCRAHVLRKTGFGFVRKSIDKYLRA